MRKYFILTGVIVAVLVFTNCNTTKKTTATVVSTPTLVTTPTAVPKSTYEGNVATIIMNNCVPCHIPAKGGRKKAYDNFANVKSDIDEMIKRIELNPTDRGFMPFKKAEKLNDSTIAIFKKWRDDGMMEKL